MLTRRCVACGHATSPLDLLEGACPGCGCHFEDRWPRTYAEMEGFEPIAARPDTPFALPPDTILDEDLGRLRRRWAYFAACVAGVVAGLILLMAAATA